MRSADERRLTRPPVRAYRDDGRSRHAYHGEQITAPAEPAAGGGGAMEGAPWKQHVHSSVHELRVPSTDLDVEMSEVTLVDEHQPLEEVAHEADDVTLIGDLVVVQDALQVSTASSEITTGVTSVSVKLMAPVVRQVSLWEVVC